jgi:hypothetical protein
MIPAGEIEALARRIYALAAADPRVPLGAAVLARRLLGPRALLVARGEVLADGSIRRAPSGTYITIAPGLAVGRANFVIAHELAHMLIDDAPSTRGLSLEIKERWCDAVAAWLVAPPEVFAARALALRSRVPRLAREFVVTETCAALRIAEVGGPGVAVATPRKVYRRGLVGLTDDDLRAGRAGPGIRKAPIRDEPGRVLFVSGVRGPR